MVSLTLKCCSSKHYFHRLVKYVILIAYKWQWVNFLLLFTNFKNNLKEQKKLFCVELVLDQLYQLLVFETDFDHFF